MLILGKRYGEPKHRGAWVLLGSCAVCGVAFLVYALSGVGFSISLLLSRLTLILHDPQYNFTTAQRMAAYGGEISLCYLLERFLPRLEAAGFPPGTLADFTVLNCRRLFAG